MCAIPIKNSEGWSLRTISLSEDIMLKFWMSACLSACISYSGFVMEMAPEGPTEEEIISVP